MSIKITLFHVSLVTVYLYGLYYDAFNKAPAGSRAERDRNNIGGRCKYLTHLDLVRIFIIETISSLLICVVF